MGEQEHVKHVGHPLARINAPPLSALEHVHPVDHPDAKDKYEFHYELVRDYYEKEIGITDIGAFLRERGYQELADEHEAKYGKPVLQQDEDMDDYDIEFPDEEQDYQHFDELDEFDEEQDEFDEEVDEEHEDIDDDDEEQDDIDDDDSDDDIDIELDEDDL